MSRLQVAWCMMQIAGWAAGSRGGWWHATPRSSMHTAPAAPTAQLALPLAPHVAACTHVNAPAYLNKAGRAAPVRYIMPERCRHCRQAALRCCIAALFFIIRGKRAGGGSYEEGVSGSHHGLLRCAQRAGTALGVGTAACWGCVNQLQRTLLRSGVSK